MTISAGASDGSRSLSASARAVSRAWESFATGEGTVQGVRPEILSSWCRCRDQYDVDPRLRSAPGAAEHNEHRFEQDVILTKLGGLAAVAGREMEQAGGIVAVSDGSGRILASYGAPDARRRAEASNLAPRSAWSERTTGTNGMGTALEVPGAVTVTGPEHWCEGFHEWACAGIAIRDVVTGVPLGTIDVSRWGRPLSAQVPDWLEKAAASVASEMFWRAVSDGRSVVAGFGEESSRAGSPLACLDLGGRAIVADDDAISLLGMPREVPMVAPSQRWLPDVPELSNVVRWATRRSLADPQWRGFARLAVQPNDTMSVSMRPLFADNRLVGMCCEFGPQEGEAYGGPAARGSPRGPERIIGVRNDRLIVLMPSEIRYAEADRNTVWLNTDRGRIQAAIRGLDNVDQALRSYGFYRVHRRFLVNLRRVAEVERGVKGELLLITDPRSPEFIPVSRRHAPEVRRLLGV
ncbi:LytTR family transcriptional regulator DNA-binding domain-containing protein [Saccharopolyspora sp. 5N708]|uniref:LytTR family transcriptional regulator DNA-binding domain-containing protein n=1 Tax=Saccharopolyspora sp. 5N708 TaxID=3457424 RepID=UPI003FD02E11